MADKNNYIHVRCTEKDKQLLNQLAKMDDRTATDWILHQIRLEAKKNNIEVKDND